ncbi:MAG: hypothetical protein ACOY42_09135 [Pseudomonadota bacterium]|jgi:hypothetical protein
MARYGKAFKERAVAGLAAVITTAGMDAKAKRSWRREKGLYPSGLET